jgi:glycosyltransferase involved in cell wall biosynthesis
VSSVYYSVERATVTSLRIVYRALPLTSSSRKRLADWTFAHLPSLKSAVHRISFAEISGRERGLPAAEARAPEDGKPQALIIEHRIPTPDRTSGSTRLQAMIDLISSRGWGVTVASNAWPEDYHWILPDVATELSRYTQRLEARGIRTVFGSSAIGDLLRSSGTRYDLVIASYPEIMHQYAPLVRASAPLALLVYDTVDLHGVRIRREAICKGDNADLHATADRYDAMESANIESGDVCIAITDTESQQIAHRSPAARVEVVPNIHEVRRETPGFDGRSGFLFIGHYLHAPNEDAMRYFVSEVLPRIERRLPDAALLMAGSSMTPAVRGLERRNVKAIGWVEDPVPWFDRCRLLVAPLRFGAGMKGKIGQAMCLGLPVVTTTIGVEGMRIEPGTHAMVADDPDAFADAVVRVHEDRELWQSLSSAALDHVDRHFSPQSASGAIDRILALAREARSA